MCDPAATACENDPDVPGASGQDTYAAPSNEHWNVTDCESEYVNAALVELVGFPGFPVIEGVGGPDAPSAPATNHPTAPNTRTASNAARGLRLALPAALLKTRLPI